MDVDGSKLLETIPSQTGWNIKVAACSIWTFVAASAVPKRIGTPEIRRQKYMVRFLFTFSLVLGLALRLCGSTENAPASTTGNQSSSVKLVYPNGLAFDEDGNLYISDIGTHRLLKWNGHDDLSVLAGTGTGGFSGDGQSAERAQLFAPHDVVVDGNGNILIADTYNHRIRRIDGQGVITTVVGNGNSELAGDNGPALQASLNGPQGIALDREGTLFIADTFNHVVRRVDRAGIITAFAGSHAGLAGDGGPAKTAQLSLPVAVAVGPDGAVYISDAGNNRIRRVNSDGTIQSAVGFGPRSGTAGPGFSGDGGPPEKSKIFSAMDVEWSAAGNLYLSDSGNNRLRFICYGVITTIAGSGSAGFSGDEGKALTAALNTPQKIAVAKDGSVYIADRANHRIRKVDPSGLISTVIGEGMTTGIITVPELSRATETTE